MCLIVFAYKFHKKYKLIMASNRDEFYKRPTLDAHSWNTNPVIIAGKDLEFGGTWLGVSEKGHFAAVTNFRKFPVSNEKKLSRGFLITDFLLSDEKPGSYMKKLDEKADLYNGFNLLAGDFDKLFYYSNYEKIIRELAPGLYGLSNHLLDTSWPKVEFAKKSLENIIARDNFTEEEIFDLLKNERIYPDGLLPETGIGIDMERILSPLFIKSQTYGTRSSNIMLIDNNNNITFTEQVYSPENKVIKLNRFKL
jgi:uncharacterized protein with NRDE domain